MIVDYYLAFQFIKRLVKPFDQTHAFNIGLIDAKGNFLRTYDSLTPEERQLVGYYDIMIINLKRLIALVPGGNTKIGTIAAAMLMLRTPVKEDTDFNFTMHFLEHRFNTLYEEIANVTGPAVAGINADDIKIPLTAPDKKQKRIFRRKKIVESTLQYHENLNPKIWDENGLLRPEIREKLLMIADTWGQFAKINPNLVTDIIITGGNVNYNYTDLSDIDLHLVVDRYSMFPGMEHDLVDEYLQDKKILWTLTHPDISIKGYPVELYAQDVNQRPHFGQGVYSINSNTWIRQPENLGLDFESDHHLQKKVDFYKDMIDKLIDQNANQDAFDVLRSRIVSMRGDSIAKGGEFAFGNLVFKELRNAGYLDKMSNYLKSVKDKALSL